MKADKIDPVALSTNPRANLDSWKKFEPIVSAAYAKHPQPYVFKPTNMSASTVASRIRDAIRGKLAFDYPSSLSNTLLLPWYEEIVVRQVGDSVYIGPKVVAETAPIETATAPSGPSSFRFETLQLDDINAFCHLISRGLLDGASIHVVHPPDVTLLPPRPNVETVVRPDGSLLIL